MRAKDFLDVKLREFVNHGFDGDDEGNDPIGSFLKGLARKWWYGNERDRQQVEIILSEIGYEIGEDESGEPDAAVFLVMAGDVNGKSYVALGKSDLGPEINEGWRDTLAGAAMAAGVALGGGDAGANTGIPNQGYKEPIQMIQVVRPGDTVYSIAKRYGVTPGDIARVNRLDRKFTIKAGDELAIPAMSANSYKNISNKKISKPIKTLSGTSHEALLISAGKKIRMSKIELAAFLAQMSHETLGFKHLQELGGYKHFANYDPKYSPGLAADLGNEKPGDGMRYKGRGYIHLTGRDNYQLAGRALGLPLEKNPELAARPDIAAAIAIWYWQQRVRPRVKNFNDVVQVTRPINPKLNGLEDRKERFYEYKKWVLAQR